MTNRIEVTAGSDDLIYLKVVEHDKTVYDDEIGGDDKAFEVNGHFTIYVNHGKTGAGWVIGIEVEVEDGTLSYGQFNDAYNIRLDMDEYGYAPILVVTTDENIVVKDYYGDDATNIKKVLRGYTNLDSRDIDDVIVALRKNDLLK